MPKSTILDHFWDILGIFRGKRTIDHKYGKNYVFDILPPHQSIQFFPIEDFPIFLYLRDVLVKNSKSRENEKGKS